MTRKVCYVTGTRADFGLMLHCLKAIAAHPALSLSICVTGMHLLPAFGSTVREIEAEALPIATRVPVTFEKGTGAEMALAIADEIAGFTKAFVASSPDMVLLLGDRGEMLAGAIAAVHLGVPIAHVAGGDRSGSVDESVRHAITKLAHYHFVSTSGARERLIRMGENPDHVFTVGAPGLDGVHDLARGDHARLLREVGFDPARKIALIVFHPIVQDADEAGEEMAVLLSEARGANLQAICLEPNADAGFPAIREAIAQARQDWPDLRIYKHLSRPTYISWLARADVMIGNSSSGIIEAASFGTPVVNVGERQASRERNANVIDVAAEPETIRHGVARALALGRMSPNNIYGDGLAGHRIAELLARLPIRGAFLHKANCY